MQRITSLSKTLIITSIIVIGTTLLFFQSYDATSAQAATPPPDEVVTYLSKKRNISIEEAQKRIDWQEKAGDLDNNFKKVLPESDYGSLWISNVNDKITIGIVQDTNTQASSKQKMADRLQTADLTEAADIVPVRYSYETLAQTSASINKLNNLYVKDGQWSIQTGLKTDRNLVEVDIPPESHLTPDHKKVLDIINQKYEDQVFFETYDEPFTEAGCNWWYCDSPLRGGVGLIGSCHDYVIYVDGQPEQKTDCDHGADFQDGMNCTAGPILQNTANGHVYILTDGHCKQHGVGWASEAKDYTTRTIGTVTNDLYNNPVPNPIDAMIISTADTSFASITGKILKRSGSHWSSREGYNDDPPSYDETYDLETPSYSAEGERVCISPAKTGGVHDPFTDPPGNYYQGGSCGEVNNVGYLWDAEGTGTPSFVNRAGYCAIGGDSGAPIFSAGGQVKGIHRGRDRGNDNCSYRMYYTDIHKILNAFSDEGIDLRVW